MKEKDKLKRNLQREYLSSGKIVLWNWTLNCCRKERIKNKRWKQIKNILDRMIVLQPYSLRCQLLWVMIFERGRIQWIQSSNQWSVWWPEIIVAILQEIIFSSQPLCRDTLVCRNLCMVAAKYGQYFVAMFVERVLLER